MAEGFDSGDDDDRVGGKTIDKGRGSDIEKIHRDENGHLSLN